VTATGPVTIRLPCPSYPSNSSNDLRGRRGIRTPDFVRVKDALYR
jgi:hypothetical protein